MGCVVGVGVNLIDGFVIWAFVGSVSVDGEVAICVVVDWVGTSPVLQLTPKSKHNTNIKIKVMSWWVRNELRMTASPEIIVEKKMHIVVSNQEFQIRLRVLNIPS